MTTLQQQFTGSGFTDQDKAIFECLKGVYSVAFSPETTEEEKAKVHAQLQDILSGKF